MTVKTTPHFTQYSLKVLILLRLNINLGAILVTLGICGDKIHR